MTTTEKGQSGGREVDAIYDQLRGSVDGAILDAVMLEAIAEAGTVGDLPKGADRRRARKHHELDDTVDVFEALDTIALEVYANGRAYLGGGWTILSVTVVTGIGGPHVEFTVSDSGTLAEGWWGSAHADRRAQTGETLFDLLSELC